MSFEYLNVSDLMWSLWKPFGWSTNDIIEANKKIVKIRLRKWKVLINYTCKTVTYTCKTVIYTCKTVIYTCKTVIYTCKTVTYTCKPYFTLVKL